MERLLWSVVCAVLIAIPVGCSDDENGDGGSAGAGAAGGTGGAAGAAGAGGEAGTGGRGTVTLTATVTEAPSLDDEFFNGLPLEDVELCEADTTNCTTTGVDGLATITLPAFQEIRFTLSKEGYAPYLIGDVTDDPTMSTGNYPMISDALVQAEAERLMFDWPSDSTGILALAAFPLSAGVTWEIDEETAIGYYHDSGGVAQTDLTATTSFGRGGFYEVSEGVHEVDFGGAASECTVRVGWPADTAERIRAPVRTGHIGYASMGCDAL